MWLAARIGKKKLLLLGLGLNAAALVIPSFQQPAFPVFLACIFLLGVGTTFLQVAGNPIMRDVSAEGNYSRNLAFAQGIKGIGSTASTYLVTAILSVAFFQSMGWRGAFPLFCVLMILAFVAVAFLNVKETKAEVPPSIGSSSGPAEGAHLSAGGARHFPLCRGRGLDGSFSQAHVAESSAWMRTPPIPTAPRCFSSCSPSAGSWAAPC